MHANEQGLAFQVDGQPSETILSCRIHTSPNDMKKRTFLPPVLTSEDPRLLLCRQHRRHWKRRQRGRDASATTTVGCHHPLHP